EKTPFGRAMHVHIVMVGKDKLGQAERVARSRFLPNLQLLVFQPFQELGIYFVGWDYLSMVINDFIFVLVQVRLVLTYRRNQLGLHYAVGHIPVGTKDDISHLVF